MHLISLDNSKARTHLLGVGGDLFRHFFSHLSFLFSFSLCQVGQLIWSEFLCQRAVIPKTINQQITVELQWLEHLWDHENLFETGVVRANEG